MFYVLKFLIRFYLKKSGSVVLKKKDKTKPTIKKRFYRLFSSPWPFLCLSKGFEFILSLTFFSPVCMLALSNLAIFPSLSVYDIECLPSISLFCFSLSSNVILRIHLCLAKRKRKFWYKIRHSKHYQPPDSLKISVSSSSDLPNVGQPLSQSLLYLI